MIASLVIMLLSPALSGLAGHVELEDRCIVGGGSGPSILPRWHR